MLISVCNFGYASWFNSGYANWSSNVGEYVDMIKAGIIDPLKVIRTALMDAARSTLISYLFLFLVKYLWLNRKCEE